MKKFEFVWDPRRGRLEKVEIHTSSFLGESDFFNTPSSSVITTPQVSIQWGSGKPGENGSEGIEQELFKKLGFYHPKIVFVPFHSLAGPENDWTRFLKIYQPLTKKTIELIELDPSQPPSSASAFYEKFEQADIIALGAGIVDPYVTILHQIHFGAKLLEWQRQGKIVYGYSAGTISICETYLHYFLGQEVLTHLYLAEQQSKEMFHLLREEILTYLEPEVIKDLDRELEKVRKSGLHAEISPVFGKRSLGLMQSETFKLVPQVVVLPHYGEYFLCTEEHLRVMAKNHPSWQSIGIPNGVALIHRIEKGKRTTEIFGENRVVPVTVINKEGALHKFKHGDFLPIPH